MTVQAPIRGRRVGLLAKRRPFLIVSFRSLSRDLAFAIVGALVLLLMMGCVPRSENEVVIYAAADREYATPILDGFEREHSGDSVQVMRQFDIEASKTLGLVKRIEGEKEKPKCDVFWNNEIMHTLRLQKQGLLKTRRWTIPDSWPKAYRAEDGSWVGFAARARVLLVNKNLVESGSLPSSVFELGASQWKGRCGMAYPVYGTTATHFAVLSSHEDRIKLDAERFSHAMNERGEFDWNRWTNSIIENAVILAGNKQVAQAVSRGELAWCVTDTDDAIIEKESGHPVEIIFPDQDSDDFGALFIPNTVSVINNGPHPIAAARLADYLVSEKIEGRLAMSDSAHFPLWPNAKDKSRVLGGNLIRWADIDFERAADKWSTVVEQVVERFGKR